jgi:hypothetical protein
MWCGPDGRSQLAEGARLFLNGFEQTVGDLVDIGSWRKQDQLALVIAAPILVASLYCDFPDALVLANNPTRGVPFEG